MLAYVFWHHPAPGVNAGVYEQSLRAFHGTLAAHAPAGFLGSAALAWTRSSMFGRRHRSRPFGARASIVCVVAT